MFFVLKCLEHSKKHTPGTDKRVTLIMYYFGVKWFGKSPLLTHFNQKTSRTPFSLSNSKVLGVRELNVEENWKMFPP